MSVLSAIDRAAELWDRDAEARSSAPSHSRRKPGPLAAHVATIRARLRRGESVKGVARSLRVMPAAIRKVRDGLSYAEKR